MVGESPPGPDAWTLGAFGVLVLIGGTNFVAVRFSNVELPPFWGAAARFTAASLLFFAWVGLRRSPLPRGRALVGALLYGTLAFGVFYALVYYALVFVGAGVAAVVLGLGPLVTFLLAIVQRLEAFRWRGIAGAAIAAGGVIIVFWDQSAAAVPPIALGALLAAAFAAAQASIVVKRFPPVDPVAMNAIGMAAGAAVLYALSEAYAEVHVIPIRDETWWAFVYLVTVGSLLLFFLFLYVLKRWTASGPASAFVLLPAVAAALGFWLAGEAVTWTFAAGAVLVVAGVYVGALARRRLGRQAPPGAGRPVANRPE